MKQQSARWTAWLLFVTLGAIALGGAGPLGLRWGKAYQTAKHRGEGTNLHGAFLAFAPLRGAHLGEANLHHATLPGANLAEAWLNEAKAQYANLAGASLRGAFLFNAKLQHARLRGADFTDAALVGADLSAA